MKASHDGGNMCSAALARLAGEATYDKLREPVALRNESR